ncbi:tautomerase family protein [Actinomadura rudentiformis]|uniref:4-oxalocrotonate tautomerase n=1 Tax=Actinomadura rudentiformis TaxID=359158 RepID=A0A6H9YIM9_9ACTN|nr:tautomerase family protein [Actinomadura rudentiformis]KAB2346524.1 4-oxalocrotonate tautomerase [Actinomadura rudentiformis]
MPKIQLTVPERTLTPEGRATIQAELARILLRWEGAPDTAFFQSLAWSYLHELPHGAQITAADELPRFLVEATVPQGALSERRKAGLVTDATSAVLRAAGLTETDGLRVWVLIHEQPDGTWGAGGQIFRHADVVALAQGETADEVR